MFRTNKHTIKHTNSYFINIDYKIERVNFNIFFFGRRKTAAGGSVMLGWLKIVRCWPPAASPTLQLPLLLLMFSWKNPTIISTQILLKVSYSRNNYIMNRPWKDLRIFLRTLLLCVVTSLGWDKGIFGICTFHIIPFIKCSIKQP